MRQVSTSGEDFFIHFFIIIIVIIKNFSFEMLKVYSGMVMYSVKCYII